MGLANCKECGKKVSTTAKSCPNCGAPEPTKKKEKSTETLFGAKQGSMLGTSYGIIIMVIVWGLIGYTIFSIIGATSCSKQLF